MESRLLYMDHVVGRGADLFAAVCKHDLEGIVAKLENAAGIYSGQLGSLAWPTTIGTSRTSVPT
jgi:ATP-dependent DNA ligase